jgi:hypothetical protein
MNRSLIVFNSQQFDTLLSVENSGCFQPIWLALALLLKFREVRSSRPCLQILKWLLIGRIHRLAFT